MSDSVRSQKRQPTRLLHPWDSLGKNTGVGCHFLLQCMKVKSESELVQSCPTQRPHGLQPTRLLHPWDFPGKSTGVGCHCPLQEKALVLANTLFQQHKRRCKTRISPDGQYQNKTDYILCSQGWRSSIQSAKTRLRSNCSSDHELLIAKVRLKVEKVGKISRPFRYDLNQIPYSYTVEATDRSKGLDLIECLKNYG